MNETTAPVRVWDLPTRCFHWLLAACVPASVVSAWMGGNAMAWHFRLGYAVLALLAFRLAWGFVGGHWSRFRSFIYGPSAVWRYVRGRSAVHENHEVGHSPLGAFSVFALLAVLAVQVATGLFADDEIANAGPLQSLVSERTSLALTRWHRGYGQWLVMALVGLHIGAIVYHVAWRQRTLVRPMLTGDKAAGVGVPAAIDTGRSRLFALVLALACAGLAAWVGSLG